MNKKAEFVKITDEQEKRIEEVRLYFSNIYNAIEKLTKPSRETSLAITKLEEAQYWAIKGITREED